MFSSVLPYLETAGIDDPVVCYQGAAVIDPLDGTFLLHQTIELELARKAIGALVEAGYPPNCYVDDRLYVAEHTNTRAYAEFQHLPVTEVGDLAAWLERPPTKLVAVADPDDMPALRAVLAEQFEGALFLTTSLPYLLELGNPSASKGTGLAFVAKRLGLDAAGVVSFGDGENDVELIEWAAFGIAVEGSHPRLLEQADWVCPGAGREGVAAVIDAYLDSLA
jgi:Cof subfamily protein (haloacid dehalogenase superfamily)